MGNMGNKSDIGDTYEMGDISEISEMGDIIDHLLLLPTVENGISFTSCKDASASNN